MSSRVAPSKRGTRWWLACLTITAALGFATALAAPRQTGGQYKVGDRVEFEHFGEMIQATVVEFDTFGHLVLRSDSNREHRQRPEKVRPVDNKPVSAGPGSSPDNPFATEEEKDPKSQLRTWSDASGKFKVTARLVSVTDENVVLQREDGQEITVPLARLSAADRRFIETPASELAEAAAGEEFGQMKETDLNRIVPTNVASTPAWDYVPEPLPPEASEARPVRIALGKRTDGSETPKALFVLPQLSQAFSVHVREHGGLQARVYACDLAKQQLMAVGEFPAGQVPVALSPDATWVIGGAGSKFGNRSNELYLYALEGHEVKPKIGWRPYHPLDGGDAEVRWAQMVAPDALLTINVRGQLIRWRIPEVEPVWLAEGLRDVRPALTASGQVLALPVADGIVLLESLSGKRVGFLPADMSGWGMRTVAIDRSGTRLSMFQPGRCRTWRLDTRELVRDFPVPQRVYGDQLAWVSDEHLLVGSRHLVDVERRVWLWDYERMNHGSLVQDGRIWFVVQGVSHQDLVLAGSTLPDVSPRELAASLSPDELLVVKPGMTASISLSIPGGEAQRKEVVETLTRRLEAAGLVVQDNGELKILGTIGPGETHDMEYETLGGFISERRTSKHRVTGQRLELKYQVGGETVWQYVSETEPPHFLDLQEGESIAQALARLMKQDPQHFTNVWLPGYVARGAVDRPLGSSPAPAG